MPFFAVPIALLAGTIIYGAIEVIGGLLNAAKRLSLLNLLAIMSVVCIPLGFLPIGAYSGKHPFPADLLLEEYAAAFLYYAFLLHLMCAIWWLSREKQQISPAKQLGTYSGIAVILLLASPYYLFGIAQTSKLHGAAMSGQVEKVAAALKPWKSVDSYSGNAGTPLGIAIRNNDKEVASFLLSKGASIRLLRRDGKIVDHLDKAVRYKRRELIELLVAYADTTSLTSALIPAVNQRDAYTVSLLIDHGAKVDDGESFYFATRQGNVDLMQLLFSRAENSKMVADTGWRGLNYFTLRRKTDVRIEIAKILLAHGADITKARDLLEDSLFRRKPDMDFAEFLLEQGCPPNGSPADYRSPLERAVHLGRVDIVRLLLKHGADPNYGVSNCSSDVRCARKETAMHEAATGSEEIARLLLAHGGDVTVVNRQKKTPLDIAIHNKNHAVANLFTEASVQQRKITVEEILERKMNEVREKYGAKACVRRETNGVGPYRSTLLVCDE